MKRLILDIETAPNLAHVWSIWNQNVGLSQLRESTRVLCFAAKWHGESKVEFRSEFHDGAESMVERAHALLSEADVLITYNGKRFDVPHLHREILLARLSPPAPSLHVDLLEVVKRKFRFVSNKLEHILGQLELEGKVKHAGHELWVRCLAGDAKAWAQMRRYNVGDVRRTEQVYDRLLPWIHNHPHMGLFTGEEHCCPNCGSDQLQRRGYKATALSTYPQYWCKACGAWSRGKTAIQRVDERGVA